MKAKQRREAKRSSKLDELAMATFQDHTHLSTYEITQRRRALEAQASAQEQEVIRLAAAMADARATLKRIEAQVLGLGMAVARR